MEGQRRHRHTCRRELCTQTRIHLHCAALPLCINSSVGIV